MPDLFFPVIDFDVSAFDSSGTSYLTVSDQSGASAPSSRSAGSGDGLDLPQLHISPSDSLDGVGGFNLPGSRANTIDRQLNPGTENTGLLDNLDFEFDATGNIIDHHMLDDFPQAGFLDDHDMPQPDVPEPVMEYESITADAQNMVRNLSLQSHASLC